jgi:hypothetical protein
MAVFWDVAPCIMELTASTIRALMMKAVSISETSVNIYQATWRNIPEDSHLHIRRTVLAVFKLRSFCANLTLKGICFCCIRSSTQFQAIYSMFQIS